MKRRKKEEIKKEDYIFKGSIEHFGDKAGGIHVDWFDFRDFKNQYFLSHAHTDHYSFKDYTRVIGLLSEEFIQKLKERPQVKIYCTAITKEIITNCHSKNRILKEVEDHFELLDNNETKINLLNHDGEPSITVTTIPANHIPGAVMFLFDDGEKRALYTGDFRYDIREDNDDMRALKNFVETYDEKIDYLYVDITCMDIGKLCHPDRKMLPTRQESKNMVCELIENGTPESVHIDADMVGAEDMVRAVAEKFSNNSCAEILSRLDVGCSKRELYKYLLKDIQIPRVKTACKTNIHIIDKAIFVTDCSKCDKDTLRIRASLKWIFGNMVQSYDYAHSDPKTWRNKCESGNYWKVLYSHHSSDAELREFLSHLKFKEVSPISEPIDCKYLEGYRFNSSLERHDKIKKLLYCTLDRKNSGTMSGSLHASSIQPRATPPHRVLILSDSRNMEFDCSPLKEPAVAFKKNLFYLRDIGRHWQSIEQSEIVLISSGIDDVRLNKVSPMVIHDHLKSFTSQFKAQFLFEAIAPISMNMDRSHRINYDLNRLNTLLLQLSIHQTNFKLFDNPYFKVAHLARDGFHLTKSGKSAVLYNWVQCILIRLCLREGHLPLRPDFQAMVENSRNQFI